MPTETKNINRIFAFIIVFVVTVAVLIAGLHWYSQTVLSPPGLPPEEPPRILSYTSFVEEDSTYFMVQGEVKNNLRTSADINITAIFYDAERNPLGNVTRRTLLKIVKPGQNAPFVLVWPLSFSAGVIPAFELSSSYRKVAEEPRDTLEIWVHANSSDESGYYRVNGTVRNRGDRKALFVSVICTFYDSARNVTLISRGFIAGINASRDASFELSSVPYKVNPASYSLAVFASDYESVFIQNYVLLIILVLVLVVFVIYLKHRGW